MGNLGKPQRRLLATWQARRQNQSVEALEPASSGHGWVRKGHKGRANHVHPDPEAYIHPPSDHSHAPTWFDLGQSCQASATEPPARWGAELAQKSVGLQSKPEPLVRPSF